MSSDIAKIRKDYKLKTLLETDVLKDPFEQFSLWWNEAVASEIEEVNAMTLATCTKAGMPYYTRLDLQTNDLMSCRVKMTFK